MKMRNFAQVILAAGVAFAFAPDPTAADVKSYPGAICQYWTANENANRSRMQVSQFGWVGNAPDSRRRLGVVCPLIRDSMRAGIDRVFVRVLDTDCASGDDVPGLSRGEACATPTSCTLNIMHNNGENVRNAQGEKPLVTHDSQNVGAAYLFANWEGISVPDFTNAEDIRQGSTIVLFCEIAPGARLTSIYVGEGP